MGLIICDRHGESGIMPFVSRELSEQVRRGRPVRASDLTMVEIVLIDDDDGEEMYVTQYVMPVALFERLGALPRYEIRTDEDEQRVGAIFDPVMKGGGVCGECFHDSLARGEGRTPPDGAAGS